MSSFGIFGQAPSAATIASAIGRFATGPFGRALVFPAQAVIEARKAVGQAFNPYGPVPQAWTRPTPGPIPAPPPAPPRMASTGAGLSFDEISAFQAARQAYAAALAPAVNVRYDAATVGFLSQLFAARDAGLL